MRRVLLFASRRLRHRGGLDPPPLGGARPRAANRLSRFVALLSGRALPHRRPVWRDGATYRAPARRLLGAVRQRLRRRRLRPLPRLVCTASAQAGAGDGGRPPLHHGGLGLAEDGAPPLRRPHPPQAALDCCRPARRLLRRRPRQALVVLVLERVLGRGRGARRHHRGRRAAAAAACPPPATLPAHGLGAAVELTRAHSKTLPLFPCLSCEIRSSTRDMCRTRPLCTDSSPPRAQQRLCTLCLILSRPTAR
mmetsp:Transcript_38716/g.121567  ORF Transcript_38716/g.121567 Transcript_38716/m.121567 type:complete len:251 (-) Transcript_38716:7-759(-)